MRLNFGKLSCLLILLLASCTPSKLFVVSVVQKSSPFQPPWLSYSEPGTFIGIGEAPSMDAASRAAMTDLMSKISQEIGVELTSAAEVLTIEAKGEISERSRFQIDSFSGSLLRDLGQRISGRYWEQCRVQTDKHSFNDFYRFYLLASVEPRFIDSLRLQTRAENDRRLENLRQNIASAERFIDDNAAARPMEALAEYVSALQAASTLFYDRTASIERVSDQIQALIRSMKFTVIEPYSEVRPTRHHFKYRATIGTRPAVGLKVNFGLTKGWGKVREVGFTDEDGEVVCDVIEVQSLAADNQVTATLDFATVIERIRALRYENAGLIADAIDNSALALTRRDLFSTIARRANVTAGALVVTDVYGYHDWFFRRVRSLNLSMTLVEHNGRDATFDRYRVTVKGWYSHDPLFKVGWQTDQRGFEAALRTPIKVGYSSTRPVTLSSNEAVIAAINELKRAHDWGIKQVAFEMELTGRDDAGNEIKVSLASEPVLWKRLFDL